jgi:toxin CcdB
MARFDLFRTSDQTLVVSLQSTLFDHLDVRLVMPLIPADVAPQAAGRLNPVVEIEGRRYLAFPQWSSGMPLGELRPYGGNLEDDGLRLLDALDMLISGT